MSDSRVTDHAQHVTLYDYMFLSRMPYIYGYMRLRIHMHIHIHTYTVTCHCTMPFAKNHSVVYKNNVIPSLAMYVGCLEICIICIERLNIYRQTLYRFTDTSNITKHARTYNIKVCVYI